MQIITISRSRKSQQVWLKFDDGSLLPFKLDDIVTHKITKLTDLTKEKYVEIQIASARYLLTEYSLRQVAISPKVEALLVQKLKAYCRRIAFKYNFEQDLLMRQIDLTIEKINAAGLLDEVSYLNHLVRKYPKKSAMELNYLLQRLKIKHEIPIDRSLEAAKIKKIIEKKYSSTDISDYNSKNKLISKLSRKGFPIELIKTTIDETL